VPDLSAGNGSGRLYVVVVWNQNWRCELLTQNFASQEPDSTRIIDSAFRGRRAMAGCGKGTSRIIKSKILYNGGEVAGCSININNFMVSIRQALECDDLSDILGV
jgi:hypothetical protein